MAEKEVSAKPKADTSLLMRGALWVAIGALIAAALVCVVWVLIGDQDGIIGRAFLTILLLAAFAGVTILETGLATRRPDWLALASMISWIVALIVGAIKIWLPYGYYEIFSGVGRFFLLLVVIGVLQLALLHLRLFIPAAQRYVTTFTRVVYYVTLAMLVLLVAMLVFYLTFPDTFTYDDLYWRFVVALAILLAVGTTLIPLLNALFAPKKPRPAPTAAPAPMPTSFAAVGGVAGAAQPALPQWPTYADGVTPLPVAPDGSPDWNSYYAGHASVQPVTDAPRVEQVVPQVPQVPSAPVEPQAPVDAQVAPQITPPVPQQAPVEPPVAPAPQEPAAAPETLQAPPVVPQAPPVPPTAPPAPGAFPPPPPAPRR